MTPIDIIHCHKPQNSYGDKIWKFIFADNTKKKTYKIVIGYKSTQVIYNPCSWTVGFLCTDFYL